MNYSLLKDIIDLFEDFNRVGNTKFENNLDGFQKWIVSKHSEKPEFHANLDWEGKSNGRTAESAISTKLVHLNRYAKIYSKAAIHNSEFSTQDEFVYLIQLNAVGSLTKMDLIKKNIQEKAVGVQIINRLIKRGWVEQCDSNLDRRSKIISITPSGLAELENHMDKIRLATTIVCGDLNAQEKFQLLELLTRLDHFHQNVFQTPLSNQELLQFVNENHLLQ